MLEMAYPNATKIILMQGLSGILLSLLLSLVIISSLRSEEHTSELQSRRNLVCRLPLEK